MSRFILVILILSTSYGYAQYYDDEYEDDYYGSPFNPPSGQQNGANPQSQRPIGTQGKSASELAGQDLQADTGRMIPSESGSVKFKVVEGEFWEPKKKRRASRQ